MDEKERQKLWDAYKENKTRELRDLLITEYIFVVKYVAGRLSMYLGNTVEYNDLVSDGIFGLIDAIEKYDISKGVKFETYASLRVRGSILDHIRKLDWVPRSLRQKQKKIDEAIRKIEKETGKEPRNHDIAKELNISIDEYYNWCTQTSLINLISLDDYTNSGLEAFVQPVHKSCFEHPEELIDRQETKKILSEVIDKLNEKEKKVIALYYYEELTLREISYILGVSESRVSQIHSKAITKIRQKIDKNIQYV